MNTPGHHKDRKAPEGSKPISAENHQPRKPHDTGSAPDHEQGAGPIVSENHEDRAD